jgi:hypothetical protein
MIPKTEYLKAKEDAYTYITIDLFKKYHTKKELEVFSKWMAGQTCGLVGDEVAIYSWDYERWISQGKQTRQGKDWD